MGWDGVSTPGTPAISVYKTGAQTLTANVSSLVVMDTVRGTPSGGMLLDASGMVQVPRAGWYQVNVTVGFAASTSSARRIVGVATAANPASFTAITGAILASAQDTSNASGLSSSAVVYLNANEYAGAWANAATNWGLNVGGYGNHLSVVWVCE